MRQAQRQGRAKGHRQWASVAHRRCQGILAPALVATALRTVEELWLYPGTAEVLYSAYAPPTAAEHVLQLLMRVYIVEGRLSAPKPAGLTTATGSGLGETFLRWKEMGRQVSHRLRWHFSHQKVA